MKRFKNKKEVGNKVKEVTKIINEAMEKHLLPNITPVMRKDKPNSKTVAK